MPNGQPTSTSPMTMASSTGTLSETAARRGALKTFLGYAPGTGKTRAMLEDALRRKQAGVDVVVGYMGVRKDLPTLQLLEKLEVLPRLVVTGAGMLYHGMDLDAVLARRPQLVLVDSLAHSNLPGSRHDKRYGEVEELLQAGIDVSTTLDVYQLESQLDAVAYLTGVTIRETVPDRFLDTHGQVVLVDMPPQELLERYRAGKISFHPRDETQLRRLFEPAYLFGLRELALGMVAQRSRVLQQEFFSQVSPAAAKTNQTGRLLVCIDSSGNAAQVVRAGRRMVDETGAAWTVLYVETPGAPQHLAERQSAAAQHLRLAEQLGAQIETISGRSAAEVAGEYARKHEIERVLVGESRRGRWAHLFEGSFAEQLQHQDPRLRIFSIGEDGIPKPYRPSWFWGRFSRMELLGSVGLVALTTALGLLLYPTFVSRSANVIMLYLVTVVLASFWFGVLPALLTAVLSLLAFDYFFIPPIYRLLDFAPENAITFFGLLAVSFIISTLVSRERSLTRSSQRRADQISQLYELSRDLAVAVDLPQILESILGHINATFARQAVVLLEENRVLQVSASSLDAVLDSSEMTAAEWAYHQGQPAGYHTGTFSYASLRYFPLETGRGTLGVLGVRMAPPLAELHPEQLRLLSVFVTKAASAVERAMFAHQANQAEILRVTEKLQTALLNSISHDLRTPLASITGALSSLRLSDDWLDPETRAELVENAFEEAQRLNRLVANLLDMTRLESGTLRIALQPCDIEDVIASALDAISARLETHPVSIDAAPGLPLVPLDYVLIQQVLVNLLENAAKYSPEDGQIVVRAAQQGDQIRVDVVDSGAGIPEEDLQRVFEKFYRVKRFEHVVGTGLGLSICKGIVEVHGGKIWVENSPAGGSVFSFTLPIQPAGGGQPNPADHAPPKEIEP